MNYIRITWYVLNIRLLNKICNLIAFTKGEVFGKYSEWTYFIRYDLFDIDLLLVQFLGNHELAHQILLLLFLFLILLLKCLYLLKLYYNLGCSKEIEKLIFVFWKRAALNRVVWSINITLTVIIRWIRIFYRRYDRSVVIPIFQGVSCAFQ